ncbi:hypothetical protein [Pontivivens ytuae]|uniref:Uncharacterized protein n=1 Tax=Pontivivens ytuae TaxID=2789856 RepID=A0A7S9QBN6_9RHOB|nr:hypothetical protein [Pontivivens ytuae]QPH53358.1 hypothetical protein I0K15_16435 [Pontivivens ytuae]
MPDADGVQREFLLTAGQTQLVSRSIDDVDDVADAATRRSIEEIASRRRTEEVRLDQLAYFFRAPDGQAYLLANGEKALVRGEPVAQCPVQISIRSAEPDPGGRDTIATALDLCHAELGNLGLEEDCGCRLLAHGAILRAELAAFEYAIDLPARLFRGGRLDPITYFAREIVEENGDRGVVIEVGAERVVTLRYDMASSPTAEATFPNGTVVPAERQPVGFDRGRLRESFTLTDPEGAALRVIVGP